MDPKLLNQYHEGTVNGMDISQGFLLGAAILMEIPIAMVLLSRILNYKSNRWANIVAGSIKTLIMVATLFVGTPTPYYLFFAFIEIICISFIFFYAWNWGEAEKVPAN